MLPHMLSWVVYGVISSSTWAINFLTVCHGFYGLVLPSARLAQASLWGARNQGQQLCRAVGTAYPSMGSTWHLTTTWNP